ncbi:MAG: flagellar motor protein MotB [Deltaproteobacteria bacterium]|nr:flagellar motor protein MotB [Deltaproteobacteria bacterium]
MIRRTKPQTDEPIPQWQTIYCSLMLLLVVFFIMLIAYSSINNDRLLQKKYIEKVAQDVSMQAPEMNQAMQSLQKLKADMGMKDDFSIVKTDSGFKAVVPNPVLFNSGDASLNEGVYAVLDGIMTIAKQNDLSIQIEGHTDNVPVQTEDFPSNWELSTMRAVNILRYLQNNGDIPPDRLVAVGFAEHHPVAGNDTPEGRQKNRRIEILFRSQS